jgi:uncharacterized protein YgiM (DUF1202 family)
MTSRSLIGSLLALTLGLALFVACGDGGDEEGQALGVLTDPDAVPTATPWSEPPAPVILSPDVLTPLPDTDGDGGGGDVDVTEVTPFTVTTDESTNLRTEPSTAASIAGTLDAGEEATVTGEADGEAVDGSNSTWYRLEDGSFVYSGAVDRAE